MAKEKLLMVKEEPLMVKEEPPMCTSCGVQVTISHILTECQTYQNLLESLAKMLNNHPQSIANIQFEIQFITDANL